MSTALLRARAMAIGPPVESKADGTGTTSRLGVLAYPPIEVAERIARLPGVTEPVEDLHVTMLYVPEGGRDGVEDVPSEDVMQAAMATMPTGTMHLNGSFGHFGTAMWAGIGVDDDAVAMRALLVHVAQHAGWEVSFPDQWRPHLTLAWFDTEEEAREAAVRMSDYVAERNDLVVGPSSRWVPDVELMDEKVQRDVLGTKHYGPGPHRSGTTQLAHAGPLEDLLQSAIDTFDVSAAQMSMHRDEPDGPDDLYPDNTDWGIYGVDWSYGDKNMDTPEQAYHRIVAKYGAEEVVPGAAPRKPLTGTDAHYESRARAIVTAFHVPMPTEEQEDQGRYLAKMKTMGWESRGAGDIRGKSSDRRKAYENFLNKYGADKYGGVVACADCGTGIHHEPDKFPKGKHVAEMHRDKIITGPEGGRYYAANTVPVCEDCNIQRGDKPFAYVQPGWKTGMVSKPQQERPGDTYTKKWPPPGMHPHIERWLEYHGYPKPEVYDQMPRKRRKTKGVPAKYLEDDWDPASEPNPIDRMERVTVSMATGSMSKKKGSKSKAKKR